MDITCTTRVSPSRLFVPGGLYFSLRSSAQKKERGPTATTKDDVQRRADAEAGSRVPAGRVHLAGAQIRARDFLEAHRDADQNLVPEQARQGQKDRKGAARPAVPVLSFVILLSTLRARFQNF